jgi:hypothetical protein
MNLPEAPGRYKGAIDDFGGTALPWGVILWGVNLATVMNW